MTQEKFQELLKSDEFKSFRKKVDSGKFDNIDWFNLENEIEKIADSENKSYEYHKIYEYFLENRFSEINDFYGHNVGDKVLKKIAKIIKEQLPDNYILYRVYSDEFAVLVDNESKENFIKNIKQISENISSKPIKINNRELYIQITYNISFEDKENLIETANMVKKYSKTNKNIAIYDKSLELEKIYEKNIFWTLKIKKALEEDKIVPYYQAIYNLKTEKIEKYESLIRLIDDNNLPISPYYFLDISKKSKQYLKLTKRVIRKSFEYFKDKEIEALGIGCFGPIDVNRNSETYGYITTTPKLAWANCDIVGAFKKALNIPVGFDTDVNGSALGEATWGITKGLENSVYITIGTGVGMGIMSNGKLLHGMLHPEAGHILMRKHPEDHYEGKCPYHKTCLEGLAAGPAIEARWGKKGIELADKKEVWELEAYYIGQALVDLILVLSPEKIILGGGVMHQEHMMPLVREEVRKQMAGYIKTKQMDDLDNYIVLPSLNDNQGIMGALKLAVDELELEK